jgi:hypothetical protein
MCSQQACSKLVNKLQQCCYFIKLLQGCHSQLVDKLLNGRTIASCWNNLQQVRWAQQPCSKLSTRRWQLANKLGTSSANTSCWQVVGTALLQVCCKFVASLLQIAIKTVPQQPTRKVSGIIIYNCIRGSQQLKWIRNYKSHKPAAFYFLLLRFLCCAEQERVAETFYSYSSSLVSKVSFWIKNWGKIENY